MSVTIKFWKGPMDGQVMEVENDSSTIKFPTYVPQLDMYSNIDLNAPLYPSQPYHSYKKTKHVVDGVKIYKWVDPKKKKAVTISEEALSKLKKYHYLDNFWTQDKSATEVVNEHKDLDQTFCPSLLESPFKDFKDKFDFELLKEWQKHILGINTNAQLSITLGNWIKGKSIEGIVIDNVEDEDK